MTMMMDITPYTNFLKSLRGQRVDYVVLAGEGVDNAFDAGASRVRSTSIPTRSRSRMTARVSRATGCRRCSGLASMSE